MFYKNNGYFTRQCNNCSNMMFNEEDIETKCNNIPNYYDTNMNINECACGFEDEFNVFPENPMLGQSYVPIQQMNQVFRPEVGLNNGTIFPELVSPYCPNQSIEEIEYIKATNNIGKGCNG